jgi:hypothetical protein
MKELNPDEYLPKAGGSHSVGNRYRDFSKVANPREKGLQSGRDENKGEFRFPSRLHYMLSDIGTDGRMR